jgi:hypothetical protein
MSTLPNPDDTELEEILDEIFAPLIDNPNLTLTTTYWNEAKRQINALITKARIDEVKKIWGHAREHTITGIEMIMHHSKGQIDFIEAVDTKHLEKRLIELEENL